MFAEQDMTYPWILKGVSTTLQSGRYTLSYLGGKINKFKFLLFKPHVEEYKKITVNVLHRTYNITHKKLHFFSYFLK